MQALRLGVAPHGLGTRHHQHPQTGLDLAAAQHLGGGAQIGQTAVGAGADEDHVHRLAGRRLAGGEAHIGDGLAVAV